MVNQEIITIIIDWIDAIYRISAALIIRLGALIVFIGLAYLICYALYLGVLCFIEYERECRWSIQRYVRTSEGKFVKLANYEEISPKPEKKKKKVLNEDAKEENLF